MADGPGAEQGAAQLAKPPRASTRAEERQRQKNFFAPGGQHNPLKRPDPDKEIQGNPSFFL